MKKSVFRVVLSGAVNTGKSSIINALVGKEVAGTSARGGETKSTAQFRLDPVEYRATGDLDFVVVDTPGLLEAGDENKQQKTIAEVARADLILFVLCGDPTADEYNAILSIEELGKPVVVVVNQMDRLSETERAQTEGAVKARLQEFLGLENILFLSASPIEKLRVVHADGTKHLETRKGEPDIASLKQRIIEIADRVGKAIKPSMLKSSARWIAALPSLMFRKR